jgi:hypothetical protein
MNVFDRLNRIQRIYDLAKVSDRPEQVVDLFLNHHVVHPPKRDAEDRYGQMHGRANQQAAALGGGRPPEPKGRWIARVGKFHGDHDDPEKAVMALERMLVRDLQSKARGEIARCRATVAAEEELLRAVEEVGSDSGSDT